MEILAQSSADFALIYNFQDTHILGASRGHLSDSVIFLLFLKMIESYKLLSPFIIVIYK